MIRFPLIAALSGAALLAACAPTLGPPPPASAGAAGFRAEDFAWSSEAGRAGVDGQMIYRQGESRFSCARGTVILTPETPWTRKRMLVLYRSAESAALPADEVRARTPSAPSGDYSAYVRRTTCDASGRFSFVNLPDGAWFAITIAKPVGGPGPSMALMKRVVTRGGHVTPVSF